jgi:hypothetical protein
MTYFERYKNGQLAEVWDELAALGEAVRDPAIAADAMSVAHLTMERVATNIERLIARLASHGYEFGFYLGQARSFRSTAALVRPDANVRRDLEDLERSAGPFRSRCEGFGMSSAARRSSVARRTVGPNTATLSTLTHRASVSPNSASGMRISKCVNVRRMRA